MPRSRDRKSLELPVYLYDQLAHEADQQRRTTTSLATEYVMAGLMQGQKGREPMSESMMTSQHPKPYIVHRRDGRYEVHGASGALVVVKDDRVAADYAAHRLWLSEIGDASLAAQGSHPRVGEYPMYQEGNEACQ